MFRFPNPGSNIDSFINIYKILYNSIGTDTEFSLDDISKILIDSNLASSSGYMGTEALKRSYNKDRSRDKLYNQSKMYAELFRTLGWFRTTSKKLSFKFSYLGDHALYSSNKIKQFVEECLLGIVTKNEIIESKVDYDLRPFFTILRAMHSLDNIICRDEIIIGPLACVDDRNNDMFSKMIQNIENIRGDERKLVYAIENISKKRLIQVNTLRNYTRFPLAILEWTNWTTKITENRIYQKKPKLFNKLTKYGIERYSDFKSRTDIRLSEYSHLNKKTKESLCRYSFFSMLRRTGFNVSSIADQIDKDFNVLLKSYPISREVLFSPFQVINNDELDEYFSDYYEMRHLSNERSQITTYDSEYFPPYTVQTNLKFLTPSHIISIKSKRINTLLEKKKEVKNTRELIEFLVKSVSAWDQKKFYPLVADLFKELGYNCVVTRGGVNYQRWDAIIIFNDDSIPIEIKSPIEEKNISVKAIRQALENKCILQSRKNYPNKKDTTSLVVGYVYPAQRSEVQHLIHDIYFTYEIKIGVFDIATLFMLALDSHSNNSFITKRQLSSIQGLINVEDI